MMDADELPMLDCLNTNRVSRQLMPLTPPVPLRAATQAQASEAVRLPVFMHDDPDRTWENRIVDCGYPVCAEFGEVYVCGSDGTDAVVRGWEESPVHSALLGNGLLIAAVIARADRPNSRQCWVVDLGSVLA